MTITEHAELVRCFAEDFTALQEAVLARMNGICAAKTAAALEHASLAGPIAVALAHADVLARGDVRRAELSAQPAERLRRLREHARKVRRARSQANAVCKEQRARHLAGLSQPVEALELRVARGAHPEAYARALREELRDRGVPEGAPQAPESDLVRWVLDQESPGGELPAPVRDLLDCPDDDFVQALLRDAREEENPYLAHDAVTDRWNRHARTALAWGRYAIAQAERDVLDCPLPARRAGLDALEDAYQDAAILAARAREVRLRIADLQDRMRARLATEPAAGLVRQCRAAALVRFAAAEPESWQEVRELTVGHQAHCAERADGCPQCHRALAAVLTDGSCADGGEEDGGERSTATALADGDRYALLDDLADTAVVAVADAAVGDESALSGHGWAAEDGTTGYGDSMASSSGEAEVIGICTAALSLLDRYEEAPVVILCDSIEAVAATNAALDGADPAGARRTLLFPEGRHLMNRLLRHRGRVQVRWLKGHIGHDLNETADALAGLALRRATGRISLPAARKEETRILRSLESEGHPSSAAA